MGAWILVDRIFHRALVMSIPRSQDHLSNVSDDIGRPGVTERAIVDEPVPQDRRSRPSRHRPGCVLVGDVNVKVVVVNDLEQCDLAIIGPGAP